MILDEFKLDEDKLHKFEQYYSFLVEENQKYNLTSITEKKEVYIKHFYDCLKLSESVDFKEVNTFCDIGSGAGFPGIPLKIMFPNIKLTIIEPTTKKINYLTNLVNLLKLENVNLINNRAEEEIVHYRDYFDIVTARAVANLPTLLELCIPFVKVKGLFLGMKGSSFEEEILISKNAMGVLNCEITDIIKYNLPENMGERVILKVQKNKITSSKYPRSYSTIKKKHL